MVVKILLIEDESEVALFIGKGLTESGHTVDIAADGEQGLQMALVDDYDALVVDRMLPKVDGMEVVQALRAMGRRTPILILSALGDVDHRVAGLEAGGDDYLPKPFAFSELLARVEALHRRQVQEPRVTYLELGDLRMDLLSRRVTRGGKVLDLQPREFKLLECLLRHADQVVTRTMLLEKVWEYHFDPQTNVIDVHISRLRSKVDRPFEKPLIHTVRGVGYVLSEAT